jgi:hypothetical protein
MGFDAVLLKPLGDLTMLVLELLVCALAVAVIVLVMNPLNLK